MVIQPPGGGTVLIDPSARIVSPAPTRLGKVRMPGHDIVVVGASAGAVETLQSLVRQLPASFPATMFVAVHMPPEANSVLSQILGRASPVPVGTPADYDPIRPGQILVGPPDHHLLVDREQVRVVRGPKHDRHRPAIDPLFESASRAHGARVLGVVLSGTLDDGAAGLRTIRRRRGLALVQDPETALFCGMPRSAIELAGDVEVVALDLMGAAMMRLIETPPDRDPGPDAELDRRFESYSAQKTDVNRSGTPSPFSCPECHGVLWQVDDDPNIRFECRIGHSFSPQGLVNEHGASMEEALEAALRALDENANLNRRIARHMRETRRSISADRAERKAARSEAHAALIREVLILNPEPRPQHEED